MTTPETQADSKIAASDRLVRYRDLIPCRTAFVDTYTPGSDQKENFTIIGPGVSESPDQHVHISLPHGFNIGGARQPPHCVNSQHSHETAEVFVVQSSRWAFFFGQDAADGAVELEPGDVISIPTHIFRGFENVGDDVGFLFAVLGGDDPGHVTWAPYVFEKAAEHGLQLMENHQLIDKTKGETPPDGVKPMEPTSREAAARFHIPNAEQRAGCVQHRADLTPAAASVMGRIAGVSESPIIGQASQAEGLPAGKFDWPHGFSLRQWRLEPGAHIPDHRRGEEEVVFVHAGTLAIATGGDRVTMTPGDTFTTPIGQTRSFHNPGDTPALVYVVRRNDVPTAAEWT